MVDAKGTAHHHSAPKNDAMDVQRKRAYSDYVQDQLQQSRTLTDHGAIAPLERRSRIQA